MGQCLPCCGAGAEPGAAAPPPPPPPPVIFAAAPAAPSFAPASAIYGSASRYPPPFPSQAFGHGYPRTAGAPGPPRAEFRSGPADAGPLGEEGHSLLWESLLMEYERAEASTSSSSSEDAAEAEAAAAAAAVAAQGRQVGCDVWLLSSDYPSARR